jgi:predicted AAA+ superfamily ATPase
MTGHFVTPEYKNRHPLAVLARHTQTNTETKGLIHWWTHQRINCRSPLIVKKSFNEYFQKGGFPEVRNVSDKIRIMIHQEYYKSILHRDIIERFNAIHPQAVVQAGYRLICSTASLYSINRITNYLKSLGYKVSKDFVSSCIGWFQDAYFLFSVKIKRKCKEDLLH